jgi:hypothetical protein
MGMIYVDVGDGVRAHCTFLSSGGPQSTSDYAVGRALSPETARVQVYQNGEATVHCSPTLGLQPEQCVAAVRAYRTLDHKVYLRWHEANRARLGLGEPETEGPEIKLKGEQP